MKKSRQVVVKNLVDRLFTKSHILFLLATASLSFGTFFNSKNFNENLVESISAQSKSRYLLKIKSNISRASTVYSFAIILKDKKLYRMGNTIFKSTINNMKEKSDQIAGHKGLRSIVKEYQKLIQRIKKYINMKKDVPPRTIMELLQKMEALEKRLNQIEKLNYGHLVSSNHNLIAAQKNVQLLFKSFHWTLTIILYVLAFVSTRKEKLMMQIKKSEELHRLLISSLAEGVIFCSEDGTVVTCNDSAEEILGKNKEKMVGTHITKIFATARSEEGEEFDESDSPFLQAIYHGKVCSSLYIKYGKGGFTQSWLSLSSQPLFKDKSSTTFSTVFSFADITEKVEQQRVIQKQQANLIYSSKMTALGQMAGGIAHEINNPLAIIKAEAEDIIDIADEEGTVDINTALDAAKTINKTSNRIAHIIKGLRIFSRNETKDKLEVIKVKDILDDVFALCEDKAKRRGIELTNSLESDTYTIKCQPTQIYQVFVNLVNNALDAVESLEEKWIKVDVKKEHEQVVIRFHDSGPGIPLEKREKIFQPFFTTKDVGKGTGLGLSISKGIIESHKGLFYIDGKFKNTCFSIQMPLEKEEKENDLPPLPNKDKAA